jgi:hypothetical protein
MKIGWGEKTGYQLQIWNLRFAQAVAAMNGLPVELGALSSPGHLGGTVSPDDLLNDPWERYGPLGVGCMALLLASFMAFLVISLFN